MLYILATWDESNLPHIPGAETGHVNLKAVLGNSYCVSIEANDSERGLQNWWFHWEFCSIMQLLATLEPSSMCKIAGLVNQNNSSL